MLFLGPVFSIRPAALFYGNCFMYFNSSNDFNKTGLGIILVIECTWLSRENSFPSRNFTFQIKYHQVVRPVFYLYNKKCLVTLLA